MGCFWTWQKVFLIRCSVIYLVCGGCFLGGMFWGFSGLWFDLWVFGKVANVLKHACFSPVWGSFLGCFILVYLGLVGLGPLCLCVYCCVFILFYFLLLLFCLCLLECFWCYCFIALFVWLFVIGLYLFVLVCFVCFCWSAFCFCYLMSLGLISARFVSPFFVCSCFFLFVLETWFPLQK